MQYCGAQDIGYLQENLRTSQDQEQIQNTLWSVCHNLDEREPQERLAFLHFLDENSNLLSCEQLVRCIGYLLGPYFSCMSELEKMVYLGVLVELEPRIGSHLLGEVFELTGIVMKDAPRQMKDVLLDLVMRNITPEVLGSPVNIMCLCNAFRLLYLELCAEDRDLIMGCLRSIRDINSVDYLNDSISFTLEQLEVLSVS